MEVACKPTPTIFRRWITQASVRDLFDGQPPPEGVMRHKDKFDPYQYWMTNLMIKKVAMILCAEMGLGKTAAALLAMKTLLEIGRIKRWLVIAPLRVGEETWPDDIWKWEHARDLTFSPILGDEATRIQAVSFDAPIHIINRENFVWLWKKYRHVWPYDGLIYDESSRLKAGQEQTAIVKDEEKGTVRGGNLSHFGALRQAVDAGFFKRRILLTGTPTPNGLPDWWGQMYIVDKGDRLGTDRNAYMRRFFAQEQYTKKTIVRDGSRDEIMKRLQDAVYVLRESDHMQGRLKHKVQEIPRWVRLGDETLKTYRRLQREMALEEHEIEADNAGVLVGKLLQLANGSIYNGEKEAIPFHDRKLEELESIHHHAAGRPLFVCYEFKFDLDRILNKFPKWRVFGEDDKIMKDWNAGKIDGLLVHPGSAGHGLNFQFGSNIQVWYGLTWNLEWWLQTNKRLDRRGQLHDMVYRYIILAQGTYDGRQLDALKDKTEDQNRITDYVRVLREDVLSGRVR
jgi:hypothetical protein